jgi:hypothetical protein
MPAPKSVLDSSGLGQVTWRSILGGKMALQETFLEKQLSDGRALVIKTYDAHLAHDAFQHIGEDALVYVANALRLGELFEASDIPETSSPDYTDFVWETLSDEAREDGNLKSFFILYREVQGQPLEPLYVSADWPSAEAFSQRL